MLLEILTLLTALPVGLILAWLTKDELIAGRTKFLAIIIISVALAIGLYLAGRATGSLTATYLAILSFISYRKSFDKKLTGKRKV